MVGCILRAELASTKNAAHHDGPTTHSTLSGTLLWHSRLMSNAPTFALLNEYLVNPPWHLLLPMQRTQRHYLLVSLFYLSLFVCDSS